MTKFVDSSLIALRLKGRRAVRLLFLAASATAAIVSPLFSPFLAQTRGVDDVSASQTSYNVLVVAPPAFNDALRPWIEYRESQGYSVFVETNSAGQNDSANLGIQMKPVATPQEIRAKIQDFARRKPISAILLVGDGAPTVGAKFGWRDVVPAARQKALVVQEFGSEKLIATDSFYSDLDENGIPDVPIGRIPAESPEELTAVVQKIIRYETASPVGNWTRKVNVVAGPNGLDLNAVGSAPGSTPTAPGVNLLSGVSLLVDSVVDRLSKEMFANYLPQSFSTSITQCSLKSAYCPYPPDFGQTFLDRTNEGALFFVYLGHGRVFGLDRMTTADGGDYGIFEIDDCVKLDSPKTAPIALFFACYTGAYDASYRSLAEEVALSPNGPVATLAASRLTAPYGMSVLGASLLEAAFGSFDAEVQTSNSTKRPKTLGEIFLQAQRKTLELPPEKNEEPPRDDQFYFNDEQFENAIKNEKNESATARANVRLDRVNARLAWEIDKANQKKNRRSFRETLDRTAAIFDPTADRLPNQLVDHVALFNLFGDPLLRVKFPQQIFVDAPEITYSTKTIRLSCEIPNASNRPLNYQAELTLADFRSPVAKPNRERTFVESAETRDEFRSTYRAANEFVVEATRGTSETNRFSIKIAVPADFSGESIIRVAATDGERYYVGAKRILVRPYKFRSNATNSVSQNAANDLRQSETDAANQF